MATNLKKMVQDRQAKTGESYQTALRHIRAKSSDGGGPFEQMVREVIALARDRAGAEKASTKTFPVSAADLVLDLLRRVVARSRGERQGPLHERLSELSLPELRKLEALMYAGREGEDAVSMFQSLPKDDHGLTVSVIAGKRPLAEYLEAGLESAKEQGVDIESGF